MKSKEKLLPSPPHLVNISFLTNRLQPRRNYRRIKTHSGGVTAQGCISTVQFSFARHKTMISMIVQLSKAITAN